MCIYGYVNNLEFHESYNVNLQFHEFFLQLLFGTLLKLTSRSKGLFTFFLSFCVCSTFIVGWKMRKKVQFRKAKVHNFFWIPYCTIYCLHFDPQNIFSICITYVVFSVGCCVALEKLAGKLSFTSVMCPWDVKNYLKKFCFCEKNLTRQKFCEK